jgi:hypothetical protein
MKYVAWNSAIKFDNLYFISKPYLNVLLHRYAAHVQKRKYAKRKAWYICRFKEILDY